MKKLKARLSSRIGRPTALGIQRDKTGRLPLLRDTHNDQHVALILEKLKICSEISYFGEITNMASTRRRLHKSDTLIELAELVNLSDILFKEPIVVKFIEMIETNLIRPIPPFDNLADDIFMDPQFEHIGFVLNIFSLFIENKKFQSIYMKRYITQSFVSSLLSQLHHPDERIREGVKTILHGFYCKFLGLRSFIRKEITNYLLSFVFEDESFNGIPQLLEILGSIVSGFTIPIKPEHKLLLTNVLIPLHKTGRFCEITYHMRYLMTEFVQKDPTLMPIIINSILKYWPVRSAVKEVELLIEVEQILSVSEPAEFRMVCVNLSSCLGKCMSSLHFQVAERSLYFMNNMYIIQLIEENIKLVLPAIFENLVYAAENHWNYSIVLLVCNILKLLMEIDEELFTDLVDKLDTKNEDRGYSRKARNTITQGLSRAEDMERRSTFDLTRT